MNLITSPPRADAGAIRVLVLAPWAFRVPRHGGQLRGAAVMRAYRDAGHDVRIAAFYDGGRVGPDERWPDDIPILPGVSQAMQRPSARKDDSALAFWDAVADAPDSFAAFAAAVRAAKPDLLQFEEPFLWPVVRRLRVEGYLDRTAVVHSSYNFETAAWRDLQAAGAGVTQSTLRDIAVLEQEIARSCDLVISVSEGDAGEFRAVGARRVCVAANGTPSLSPPDRNPALDAYIPVDTPYALFVSSAHPPNAHGLVEMAAGASGHPLRHGEIMICGNVGSLVRTDPHFKAAGRVLGQARFLGWVENDLLGALYAGCRAIILPKTLGGGSNLKTAEALASFRPIVATTRAFEGFEPFTGLPGVTIADEPDEFWCAVDGLLSGGDPVPPRPPEAMAGLLWSACLEPMVRAAESVVRERRR